MRVKSQAPVPAPVHLIQGVEFQKHSLSPEHCTLCQPSTFWFPISGPPSAHFGVCGAMFRKPLVVRTASKIKGRDAKV